MAEPLEPFDPFDRFDSLTAGRLRVVLKKLKDDKLGALFASGPSRRMECGELGGSGKAIWNSGINFLCLIRTFL